MEKLTQKEAAKRLEVSPKTLRRHEQAGRVTRLDDGSYPWPLIWDEWRKKVQPQENLKQTEAAERLGVDVRWVRTMTRDGILSRNEDKSYPYPRIQAEHDAFLRTAEDQEDGGDGQLRILEERARLTKEKADAQMMANAVRRAELVAVEDVEILVRRSLDRVNKAAEAIPTRFAPRLAKEAGLTLVDAKKLMVDIKESIRGELHDLAA